MGHYKMTEDQLCYDVFPLVVKKGTEATIHIRSLGGKRLFETGRHYNIIIAAMECADPADYPCAADYSEFSAMFTEDGFEITHSFDKEQEYCIAITDDNGEEIKKFYIYCVGEELSSRYPFIGDLHIHTNMSDGAQLPEVVCADYRKYGYDFMTISDHNRYYPSLRAINCYKDVPTELTIVPGEEVHLPAVNGKTNDIHIVNFGGEYSINSLVEDKAVEEVGKSLSVRAIRKSNVPEVMTIEEYSRKMQSLADNTVVPDGIDAMPVAVSKWIFDEIRNSGGLGIFAHPNWRCGYTYQVPERLTDYFMEKRLFDAFEVLGGENYYEQNGFQTIRYYEQRAKGNDFPIVGSTDSHSSSPYNRNAFICSTIVFAEQSERLSLINAIKQKYSVAVDTINEDFRLVGDNRLVRYACFLLKNYFPLHDELCFEEGRLMKQYATGTADEKKEALKLLSVICGRVERQRRKYFSFS